MVTAAWIELQCSAFLLLFKRLPVKKESRKREVQECGWKDCNTWGIHVVESWAAAAVPQIQLYKLLAKPLTRQGMEKGIRSYEPQNSDPKTHTWVKYSCPTMDTIFIFAICWDSLYKARGVEYLWSVMAVIKSRALPPAMFACLLLVPGKVDVQPSCFKVFPVHTHFKIHMNIRQSSWEECLYRGCFVFPRRGSKE